MLAPAGRLNVGAKVSPQGELLMFYPIEIAQKKGGFRAFSRDIPELATAFDTLEELKEEIAAFVTVCSINELSA